MQQHLQKRLYRTDSSRLIVSQPSPLFIGRLAFHIARRYRISKIEKTTNLKNAAVAKALNKDSASKEHSILINRGKQNFGFDWLQAWTNQLIWKQQVCKGCRYNKHLQLVYYHINIYVNASVCQYELSTTLSLASSSLTWLSNFIKTFICSKSRKKKKKLLSLTCNSFKLLCLWGCWLCAFVIHQAYQQNILIRSILWCTQTDSCEFSSKSIANENCNHGRFDNALQLWLEKVRNFLFTDNLILLSMPLSK